MPNQLELRVNGKRIRDWYHATIQRTLGSFTDTVTFSFALHSGLGVDAPHPLTLDGGAPAEVFVDGALVLTGSVVAARARGSASDSTVEIEVF